MKIYTVGLLMLTGVSGVVGGYWLADQTNETSTTSTTSTTVNPVCSNLRKEERKIIDMYTFLLSRDEIRLEEDRRAVEREFHDKLAEVVTNSEKKNCP